ncbi:hypothetical protein K6120_02295 [Neisseria flava]|nr:hypothetical protein [Neisseria sicca]MBY6282996.1 hypothetical protein [Neisseria flava]
MEIGEADKRSSESFEVSDDLVFIGNLPPLPSGGRGWLYGVYEYEFAFT